MNKSAVSATTTATKSKSTTTSIKSTKTSRKKQPVDDQLHNMLTKVQRYQLIESMLNESFPLVTVLIVIFADVALALSSIGFQIASIILQTDLYYIACG